ncbi:hypothetical protein [Candidatus Magnetaquicoccus inordinatus]|uniref:hypothetical protein n=1 Tax=Candidatus Magnetaquicoccus inordinatus TaxID=2496818 RepID=UPI00102AE411|nr:hypothetical protein [Candidatus Magnetaquicoccus inordinatus]
MSQSTAQPANQPTQPAHTMPPEKPLVPRLQRLFAGKPQEDVILDPDNPNLIMERKEQSSSSD